MRWRRILLWAAALVLIGGALGQSWVNGHTVDLVVVNASGKPVQIAWQSGPFGPAAQLTDPGCNTRSMPLSRGTSWSVARDGEPVLDSSAAGLPLLSPMVAVEVWLGADGSIRIVAAHDIERLVDAPMPDCQNTAS